MMVAVVEWEVGVVGVEEVVGKYKTGQDSIGQHRCVNTAAA